MRQQIAQGHSDRDPGDGADLGPFCYVLAGPGSQFKKPSRVLGDKRL